MSQSIRQSELFTAQDWTVLYTALTNINFNASDPPTIARALRQYIQSNFAENFNDWIASSEEVIVIETLAWLAGILAFKTDVSGRENFWETATARESILRLARFLSYNARRNQCAQGILKVVALQTNDDVYDASQTNLNGTLVNWNDPNNPDWFDQIAQLLNAALVPTNPIGVPLSSGTYAGVKTDIYRLNASFGANIGSLPFTAFLDGTGTPFEIINLEYDPTTGFSERTPDPYSALQFTYRSDGFGNASPNTGFFFGFKQGQLQSQIFSIATPIENQLIDIKVDHINQTDVWVQSIDDQGNTTAHWRPVPIVFTDNITFNSLPASQRNIYQIITRDDDQISLRFSDGRFGNAPSGYLRTWYRTSNDPGLVPEISPADLATPKITINYTNRRGAAKTLTLYLELQNTISNSVPAETIEQIRLRAPLVYATQNRMVSGEDYNTFPIQSNLATKIKALVRTYSGQSRFIDLNDPTSNYQDTTVFGDDGLFYREEAHNYVEVPLSDNLTTAELIDGFIQPALTATETQNLVRSRFLAMSRAGTIVLPSLSFTQSSSSAVSCTGYFNVDSSYLRQGALVQFNSPDGTNTWAAISSVNGVSNTVPSAFSPGPVQLAAPIATGSGVIALIPRYASSLTATMRTTLIGLLSRTISFDLWYDHAVVDETAHIVVRAKNYVSTSATEIKVLSMDCISGALWRLKSPGLRYVFESRRAVRFFFDGSRAVDTQTGQAVTDLVSILDINMSPNGNAPIGRNYNLQIDKMIRYANGYTDPTRIAVKFIDADNDGYPDDPDTFVQVTSSLDRNTYLFWQTLDNQSYIPLSGMIVFERETDRQAARGINVGTTVFQIASPTAPNSFFTMTATGWEETWRGYRFGIGQGANVAAKWLAADGTLYTSQSGSNIRFMWKHYVPTDRRIDPSRSNIIDLFVLPISYDQAIRRWITDGANITEEPPVPTDFELRQSFSSYELFKVFSDDIVWRPVRYRYLFGQTAEPALRAKIKVVKLVNTNLSDGEIKGKVLSSIKAFFSAALWDFGDTFYFSECSTYLQSQLAGIVASVVIVPEIASGSFGDLYEIDLRADELPISTATINDIIMIDANTASNLRIR